MVFLLNLGRIVFAPLVLPLQGAFPIDEAGAGVLVTLSWVGGALVRIPTGYVLTRVSRARVVLGAGALMAVSAGLAALAPTVEFLAAAGFAMGVAAGAYFIAANPLISELYPGRVGRAMGVHGTAAQLAAVGAAPLVTVVLWLWDYRLAFVTIAAGSLVVTVLTATAVRRTDLPSAGVGDRDLLGAIRSQWRLVLTGVAIIGAVGFVWQGVFNFYPSYLTSAKNLPEPTANVLLTVVFAAGVPAFAIAGRLADRLPHVPLVFGIIGAFGLCLFALTFVQGLFALAIASVVLGLVVHGIFPVMDTFMLHSLPDNTRASAYSAYSGSMALVGATGSSAVGILTGAGYAFELVFRGFAVLVFAVLLCMVVLRTTGRLPTGQHPS